MELSAWRELLATTTLPWFLGFNSQSLVAVVHQGLGFAPPVTTADLLPAQALATAPFALLVWPLRRDPARLAACLLVGVALVSPLAWRANFVLAWPAFLVLARRRWAVPALYFAALVAVEVALTDGVLAEPAREALLLTRALAWLMAAGVALVLLEPRSASPGAGWVRPP